MAFPPRSLEHALSSTLVMLVAASCTPSSVEPTGEGTDASSDTSTGAPPPGSTTVPDTSESTADSDPTAVPTSTTGTDTSLDDTGTSTSDTGPEPCGNGTIEPGEECDGTELAGGTCDALGFAGGTLACGLGCLYDTTACGGAPEAPVPSLAYSAIKRFDLTWAATPNTDSYQLLESAALGEPYVQLGGDIVGESVSITVPLHLRREASYVVRSCNVVGCTDSDPVAVAGSLVEAVGYAKPSNTGATDWAGFSVALSSDGTTLAIGAPLEDSGAPGIGGNEADDSTGSAGAVYVLVRDAAGAWSQQAYVKASNPDGSDWFGWTVALSGDGNTLAVGARDEDSSATGIGGDQADDSAFGAGAAYVFTRDGAGDWSQQAYVKASNPGSNDSFGIALALSSDGSTLAVGANHEDSSATGIGGNQASELALEAGAAYVFTRNGAGTWSQQAYVKASNTDGGDLFGSSIALSGDGSTLAVGATGESSFATGIGGNQADDSGFNVGAVYVYARSGAGAWSQQAYVKASNPDSDDSFGRSVALAGDGATLAVGAPFESSSATDIDGDQTNDSYGDAGAVYVYVRDAMDQWSQQVYVKAPNTGPADAFGTSVALGSDGDVLAIGAFHEDGSATGLGGATDNLAPDAGAAYVLTRDAMEQWSHRAYVKASNAQAADAFGTSLALAGDAGTLAIGAYAEDGNATGLSGDQANDLAPDAGAVYLY